MVLLQRKLYFPKDPEVVQHFPGWEGGVQLFPGGGGGPNANFYRNPYGGGGGGGNPHMVMSISNPYNNEVSYKGTVLFDY